MKFISKPEFKEFFTRLIEAWGCDDYSLFDFLYVQRKMDVDTYGSKYWSYMEQLENEWTTPDEVIKAAKRGNPE